MENFQLARKIEQLEMVIEKYDELLECNKDIIDSQSRYIQNIEIASKKYEDVAKEALKLVTNISATSDTALFMLKQQVIKSIGVTSE